MQNNNTIGGGGSFYLKRW